MGDALFFRTILARFVLPQKSTRRRWQPPIMEKPDTITVTVCRSGDISADKVDLHVSVHGMSLITGNAALKRAKEVAQLVAGLCAAGVKEEDVLLEGIQAKSADGMLGRFNTAKYHLRIRCNDLENLPDILGVVTAQKTAELQKLSWRYPDQRQAMDQWVQSCLTEAREKAGTIASGLGIRLVGVHEFTENWFDPDSVEKKAENEGERGLKLVTTRMQSADLGLELSSSKKVQLRIEVHFRVEGLEGNSSSASVPAKGMTKVVTQSFDLHEDASVNGSHPTVGSSFLARERAYNE